ncbi:hypothetical protein OF83DRAFT_374973 [Amylostereum chailletii]|nr:hypothetical protein OF83DRAFT_374973 [Amylostereum chailletii]
MSRLRGKLHELDTLISQRVYCANPQCSTFLGPSGDARADVVCNECGSTVCTGCKNYAHPGDDCISNTSLLALRALADAQRWQTCPGCGSVVEHNQGCYHMTCICTQQFCYLCASPWKTCTC